jgi:hypothetical protein
VGGLGAAISASAKGKVSVVMRIAGDFVALRLTNLWRDAVPAGHSSRAAGSVRWRGSPTEGLIGRD